MLHKIYHICASNCHIACALSCVVCALGTSGKEGASLYLVNTLTQSWALKENCTTLFMMDSDSEVMCEDEYHKTLSPFFQDQDVY